MWSDSCRLAESIYIATASMSHDERFGLTSQTRRASVAVASKY
ncbi:MAG: four helix bundle protein [Acidimicrobiia bacterium]|nr:four helix bundle protein [Acidimicrobiia bacterium]